MLKAHWIDGVNKINPQVWNRLAQPLATPFLHWEWLANLESSGCAVAREGWLPNHLVITENNTVVAIVPLYLKGHSYGEFVFDYQWANLAYRLGINYYPKLLGMTPFTPATGYRFLIDPNYSNEEEVINLALHEIDSFCLHNRIAGCHFLFVDPEWKDNLETRGFSTWMHHSYIWSNQNFHDFNDYLQTFNANQRRNIKRERKSVTSAGVQMKVYTAPDIPHFFYSYMYELYSSHCDKFWGGSKYLNRKFFEKLAHNFQEYLVFVAGEIEGYPKPVGMSFCIRKGDRLYGRYWGCIQEIDCLHFDACYYTPIEWAIKSGIKIFDPGAGGEHKKRRGFPATPNYSLHRFYHDRLKQILVPYLQDINKYEAQHIEAINHELPFDFQPPSLEV
ncbi:MAG: GNAT family N-acetyltransferase [Pseudanabaenaceae cyanobacterium]